MQGVLEKLKDIRDLTAEESEENAEPDNAATWVKNSNQCDYKKFETDAPYKEWHNIFTWEILHLKKLHSYFNKNNSASDQGHES